MNFSNITVGGHIGKDAEQVTTQSGKLMTKFSLAVNVGFGDKKVTNWFDCIIFGERGTSLMEHLTKGKAVLVNGELKVTTREHEGKNYTSLNVNVQNLAFAGSKDKSNEPVEDDVVPF